MKYFFLLFFAFSFTISHSQSVDLTQKVNPFLGASGDHGQMSPAASYPFSMLSIGPQTYPTLHAGYEYKAKEFLGFTHNRFEGVGCRGSGGNILIKPFAGNSEDSSELIKQSDEASLGYYSVKFKNGISAAFTVCKKEGVEVYQFPGGGNGLFIDLSYAFTNKFISEAHTIKGNLVTGWVQSGTTCRMGAYKVYYCIKADEPIEWKEQGEHTIVSKFRKSKITLHIALSSVSEDYAKASITNKSFEQLRANSTRDWNRFLTQVEVKGDKNEEALFYSLLYRTLQSPYSITENDGTFRAGDGSLQKSKNTVYNGWSVWDNYKTQLPLLSIAYSNQYKDIMTSLANLYKFGKQDWATHDEPTNTVRTEHSIVVLLDAWRKGYPLDFNSIIDQLIAENKTLDFSHPDKALESSYDTWALSQILIILHRDSLANVYKQKALNWRTYWNKDFADLSKPDVDQLEARDMYQGTIWQYRWFAPFDQKGLVELCGGEDEYIQQLDEFFKKDLYNAANEPDIQVPYMYNFTSQPWRSQEIIHKFAIDTVVQYYTDINYRGINPQIGRVYNNRPDGYLQTMDDDAGAMSGWYIFAAIGLSPACVGWPVYYLHMPLFPSVTINATKSFTIAVSNFGPQNKFIQSATLNGKQLERNWLTQEEIQKGGKLVLTAGDQPNKNFGLKNRWITGISGNK